MLVENANRRVRVSVENGTLLGMDNGDASDYDQYQTDSRRLFNGKLLAIVSAKETGETIGEATGEATGEASGVRVSATFDDDDIPIRKIELSASGFSVSAKILPENATWRDLLWRLTDAGGIDSPLGTLTVAEDGMSAVVTPKGDGEVFVRCCAKNGSEHIALISRYSLEITGRGKPFLDPYAFVSAGLSNYSNVELTNGNERGVATIRDGESHLGFKDVDFGDYGSDTLTLPLFPLMKEPFDFEIWEGMPLEGGEKLYTAHYDKGSVWNTYQDVTYRLPRRLRGVTGICLVFRQKVHVKGFSFAKLEKAFAKLPVTEYSKIYGDTFTITADAIENIGNNVSIVFENMDFGERGTSRVEFCWRSDIEKNSVQILFGDERTMVSLESSPSWSTGTFDLGRTVTGTQTVTLSFLPGCKIDLSTMRFLE
jgi:beta-galactosidase